MYTTNQLLYCFKDTSIPSTTSSQTRGQILKFSFCHISLCKHFLLTKECLCQVLFTAIDLVVLEKIIKFRQMISHMIISSDNTFLRVPVFLILWPWSLAYFLKTLTVITFEQWVQGLWHFMWQDLSVGINIFFYLLTLTFEFDLAAIT